MAHVNLLPWRAQRRKLREREFFMQLVVAFAVGVGALLLWYFWMNQRIDNQNDRNAYLQTEIKQLDVRIDKIKDLETVREHLLARKQIIEELQADRSQMVHLFDELVKTTPPSARLTGLKQAGDSMTLDGVAQSNASVAQYMRNIEASPWMGHADLSKTENTHSATRMPYTFGLKVALLRPKADEMAASDAAAVDAGALAPASAGSAAAPAALGTEVQKVTATPEQAPPPAVKPPQAPAAGGTTP